MKRQRPCPCSLDDCSHRISQSRGDMLRYLPAQLLRVERVQAVGIRSDTWLGPLVHVMIVDEVPELSEAEQGPDKNGDLEARHNEKGSATLANRIRYGPSRRMFEPLCAVIALVSVRTP